MEVDGSLYDRGSGAWARFDPWLAGSAENTSETSAYCAERCTEVTLILRRNESAKRQGEQGAREKGEEPLEHEEAVIDVKGAG